MNTLTSLFAYKTWADTELLCILEQVALTKPLEKLRPVIRRLNHVNVSDRIFRAHLTGEGHIFTGTNTEETPTVSALTAEILENDKWFENYVTSSNLQQLQEVIRFTFTDGDKGAMSHEEILLHVITHGGYHRGNVGEMLEGLGIDAPRDLYTRFLHCSQPLRRQA